jgi:hypothetical protein
MGMNLTKSHCKKFGDVTKNPLYIYYMLIKMLKIVFENFKENENLNSCDSIIVQREFLHSLYINRGPFKIMKLKK